MTERDLIASARLHAKTENGLLFRNSVGQAWQGRIVSQSPSRMVLDGYRKVVYGLHKGSSDLIGLKTILITPEMVGQELAQFWCMEIKTKNDRLSNQQKNWLREMEARGAICGVMQETGAGWIIKNV